MACKKEYWCNICMEKPDNLNVLIAVKFVTNYEFNLIADYKVTDGKHICSKCLSQIYDQAASVLPF